MHIVKHTRTRTHKHTHTHTCYVPLPEASDTGFEEAHNIEELQDFDCQHAMTLRMVDFAVKYVYYVELHDIEIWNITWTYPNIGDALCPGPRFRPRSLVQAVLEQPGLLSWGARQNLWLLIRPSNPWRTIGYIYIHIYIYGSMVMEVI